MQHSSSIQIDSTTATSPTNQTLTITCPPPSPHSINSEKSTVHRKPGHSCVVNRTKAKRYWPKFMLRFACMNIDSGSSSSTRSNLGNKAGKLHTPLIESKSAIESLSPSMISTPQSIPSPSHNLSENLLPSEKYANERLKKYGMKKKRSSRLKLQGASLQNIKSGQLFTTTTSPNKSSLVESQREHRNQYHKGPSLRFGCLRRSSTLSTASSSSSIRGHRRASRPEKQPLPACFEQSIELSPFHRKGEIANQSPRMVC